MPCLRLSLTCQPRSTQVPTAHRCLHQMCEVIVVRSLAACRVAAPRLFSLTNESIR
jgi:hypothetical protein